MVWKDWRLFTLAAGMALGLFAQIGLLAHLFSLLVPALGPQLAGFATGGATAAAIAGRTLVGWLMPAHADPAAIRLRQLRRADCRLARFVVCGWLQRTVSAAWRCFVRGRNRQHDVAAANDCPGRISERGRVARRPTDRRSRARHLCLCTGRVRVYSRIRAALGLAVRRRRAVAICRRSLNSNIGCSGVFHRPPGKAGCDAGVSTLVRPLAA